MMRRFATVRSFLPALASAAPFAATVGGTPTLAALTALPDILDGRKKDLGEFDLSVLSLAWQATKNETLRALQLPEEPAAHLQGVSHRVDVRYRVAAEQLPDNPAVRIDDAGKVHLSPLEARTIRESLK